jgi:hypothetical protein
MSYHPRSYEAPITAIEKVKRDELLTLVIRYEAVRLVSSRDRNMAMLDLEHALQRYGQPFVCGKWIYRWCREEDSITRLRHSKSPVH